ncbi:MAG TPA: PAC2 family protein [Candidatus Thermoplasmatota archaeon]|nr:PAC2 family protein [Candidatus Thermoplasmatota archaeon]
MTLSSTAALTASMPEPTMETFAPIDLKDALVIAAFPTTGSAASIAAQYLVRTLEIPLVGHLRLPELSAVTAIQDGRATSAVRIFGGEVACKLDKKCPRIFIVTTELAPPPSVALRLSETLLDWAGKGGAHLVIALEGVVRGEGDDSPDVFCAAANDDVLKELRKTGIPAMERALIGGITAHLLLLAPARKVRSGAVMVEATREHPDGRAAVALIEALGKIMPDVIMDAKPLLKEAMQLEADLKRMREGTETTQFGPPTNQFI